MPLIDIDKETKEKVIGWLAGQSFTNVLLAAVLSAIGYFIMSAMPMALKQVQLGYEGINKENREDRQQIRKDNLQLVNLILHDKGKPPIPDDTVTGLPTNTSVSK